MGVGERIPVPVAPCKKLLGENGEGEVVREEDANEFVDNALELGNPGEGVSVGVARTDGDMGLDTVAKWGVWEEVGDTVRVDFSVKVPEPLRLSTLLGDAVGPKLKPTIDWEVMGVSVFACGVGECPGETV